MKEAPTPRATRRKETETDLAPIIMKWVGMARRFWYWIVLSVIACLILGYVYQMRQSRVYQSQAVILIETNDGNGGSNIRTKSRNSQVNTLMQLNGINAGDNLENEMFILSSLRLMKMVVPKLGLDVDYTTKHMLHDVALYRNRPFFVKFDHETELAASMNVTIEKDGAFHLTQFQQYGERKLSKAQQESEVVARAGQHVKTPIGYLTIEKDNGYDKFERGKVVEVAHYSVDAAAGRFRKNVSASELDKESTLIILSCNDINKDRAKDILYELINIYKQDVVDNKNREATRTAEFIDGRIELISRELSDVESQLADFKSANKITDLSATASVITQQGMDARKQTNALATQLAVAKYLADYLHTTPGSKDVIPIVSDFNNSTIASQIRDYNTQILTRNRMANNSSENSPAVREMDYQLESMRKAINSSLSSYVQSMDMQYRAALANENQLTGQAGLVPGKEKQALDISRQQNLKEALYTYLLNKREEVALQLAIEEANVRVIEDPASNNIPIAPRTKIIMFLALLLGLIIPFAILYLIELFDTTISSRKDVEEVLTAPIAGELPHLDHSTDQTLVYGRNADLSAPIAEAFRLLRYGLHCIKTDAKVFLVTSSTPSQGKSFVSRNLAGAFAMTNKRVLLVDVDIRVRNLSRSYGARTAQGLTEYLIGDVTDAKDIIIRDGVTEGVDFLPAGITPPNTTELLMEKRLEDLMDELRQQYDIILLDTTPVFAVADASIVSRVADLTVFVIRIGKQVRAGMAAVEELYKNKKCGNLCLVINDSDLKTRTYGYGYRNGYSYSYSYQYGYGTHKRPWYKFWKKHKKRK